MRDIASAFILQLPLCFVPLTRNLAATHSNRDRNATASSRRVLRRITCLTSMRCWRHFSDDDVGAEGADEMVRVRNQSEISRRGLQNDFHFFFPMYPSASMIVPDRPVVDYKTKLTVFDYMSLRIAILFKEICAIPRGRAANRWTRKLTQNFLTPMDIHGCYLTSVSETNGSSPPAPIPIPRTIVQSR
jgi:hypothetical protein